jgi:hypothetical protein
VVPGFYAWLATVLVPVAQDGAPWGARAFSLLAVAALAGGSLAPRSRPRLARALGVYAFVLCCFVAWAWLGQRLRADQVDPLRGALGAVGFLLHALAWGAPPKETPGAALDNLLPGAPLQPRQRLAPAGAVVLGLGIAVALVPTVLAFRVERSGPALLAHAVALGAGVLLVGASAEVALLVGKPLTFSAWRARGARALWPLGALSCTLALGLLWLALR